MQILGFRDLRDRGIRTSKVQLRRQWTAGKFPKPFQLVDGGPLCWTDEEINAHISARIAAARDRVGGA
jgi:predicted DNA-binding transcriptional regulator AlpA